MYLSFLALYLSTLINVAATMTSSTSQQACAACKYQRRKCSKDCPLAPFFPADQPEKFQSAHRLYGVRNMMSILNQVRDESKQDAMTSVVFESDMRARFPVHGCLGILAQLQAQLDHTAEELRLIRAQIDMCKPQGLVPDMANNYNNDNVVVVQSNNVGDVSGVGVPVVFPNINRDFLANGIYDVYLQDDKVIQNPNFSTLDPAQLLSSFGYPNQLEIDVSQFVADVPIIQPVSDGKQSPLDTIPKLISEYISQAIDHQNVADSVPSTELKDASFGLEGEEFQRIETPA